MAIKSYKGMDRNMQCRGFQYEVGETYTTDKAVVCKTGFHACEYPLDVFQYYPPSDSRFFEVEQSGEISNGTYDSKASSSEIKIVAEIGITGLANAAEEYAKRRDTTHADQKIASAGFCGVATVYDLGVATAGDKGVATAGDKGVATAGDKGVASAGFCGVASAGVCGVTSAGDQGASLVGDRGVAAAGDRGYASAGDCGTAVSRGSASTGWRGLSVARGNAAKASGDLGSILVIGIEDPFSYRIKHFKAVIVDGKKVKADTWYTLNDNGELVEVLG